MVLTRSEAKTAYTHVLDNVLGPADGTPLKLALEAEGIDDIFGLTTLTDAQIDTLKYIDVTNNNSITPVKLGDRNLLRCFLRYVYHCHADGNPIGDDWSLVAQAEFDSFWIDPRYATSTATPPTSNYATSNVTTTADTNVVIFRSHVQPFTSEDPNVRAELVGGEELTESDTETDPIIKSADDLDNSSGAKQSSTQQLQDTGNPQELNGAVFNPEDLIGKTFLLDKDKDGQQSRARIVKLLRLKRIQLA
jgi:hypothetical protein